MSFPGETVTVVTHVETGTDRHGAKVTEPVETPVENVLVAPGALSDLGEDRPDGVEVKYTLQFPKTFAGTLEGADVIVRGEPCPVIGHPDAYNAAWCPTQWNRTVEVGGTHG